MRHSIFSFAVLFFALLASPLFAGEIVYDFESGKLADDGWAIVEGENSKPIGNRAKEFHGETVDYAKHGEYYLTTLEREQDAVPVDVPTCRIESPVFTLEGGEIRLLIGGGNREKTFAALAVLKEDGSAEPVLFARGENSQGLKEIVWDASPYIGKKVLFQVVDGEIIGWGHIRCDWFRAQGTVDPAATEFHRQLAERLKEAAEKAARERREKIVAELPEKILYVTRSQYRPDHHNTATLFQKGEINVNSFVGKSAMKVWFPKTDETKTLLELPAGIVRDPTISFDGTKVLFSFRKSKDDDYHLGEMTLDFNRAPIVLNADTPTGAIDGFRQITFLSGVSDIDPIYLPDGRFLFSSTREPKYCMCNRHIMGNLYVANADGTNIEQIGKSTLFEGHPSLLPDGRVIYDRWEYVDRNFGDAQGVWVTNPDGTKHEIFWGNNTASPGGVIDARIMPGSDSEFICVFGSCHDRPWGSVALVDRRLGIDGKEAVIQTWPAEAREWVVTEPGPDPIKEVGRYDTYARNTKQKFEDPFPLSDDRLLASGQTGRGEEMGIYALDMDGSITPLHEDPESCFDPMPIRPSEAPTQIADRIDRAKTTGTFIVSNVYEGMGMEGVAPGSIKYLRVVESPEKRFWTHTLWDKGNGTQAPGMAWDDFNNKRILGTVEVEKDGSVKFEVPAEKYLYFQVLDENKMMIQSMRSGIMARPGETNACVGCHESRIDAPSSMTISSSAVAGEAKKLEPWFGEPRLFSYRAEVQPVFDKYCLACHDYGGPAAGRLVLAGDRNMLFSESYRQLREKGFVRVAGAGPHNLLPAESWGAAESRLGKVLLTGHPDPMIDKKRKELGVWFDQLTDPESYERVITWIDINAPYYPTYGSAYRANRFGRSPLTEEQTVRLEELVGRKDLKFEVSFDRPEKSACLSKWADDAARQSAEYKEALGIIQAGQANLAKLDRGEDPQWAPSDPIEIDQQKKYDALVRREQAVRRAILAGEKMDDRPSEF